jgi:hypothetical protein
MSFSNAPDLRTLGLVAGALAVDEAFVEKDWFVVQAIRILQTLKTDNIVPVFSGGTSLLKGHGLIKRFSEDIDFKLGLSERFLGLSGNQRRNALGTFKGELVAGWGEAGFVITNVVARDGNGFIRIEMDYPTLLDGHDALRPHILAELSAKPARRDPTPLPLMSFVNTYRSLPPEVDAIACVDPVETAADKLSAFAWRALTRDRASPGDDPAIVRHLHDLAALEPAVSGHAGFPGLLMETMLADTGRGSEVSRLLSPGERLAAMSEILAVDPLYSGEYARFVEGMAFAGAGEVPSFAEAVAAVARLCALLPDSAAAS